MKYQTGSIGRVVVARFDDKDEVIENLTGLLKKEGISAAVLYLVGGVRKGRAVVGPKQDTLPPDPVWKHLDGPNEVLAFGTVFPEDGEPKIHLHAAWGNKGEATVGCLREITETFIVLEAVIMEITGIDARRELDPAVGLALLKL